MRIFDQLAASGHEEVVFGVDEPSGLRTIVAIHDTTLGPALGGTRFHGYPSDDEALADVLRLSRSMTLKAAAAGLDLGGGKAVIVGDPKRDRSERLLRAYGRFVEALGGRYITAEDVGTSSDDMAIVARETRWVAGLPRSHGGSGDPSPFTARGVLAAMRTVAESLWGRPDLTGRRVAVQGVGKVGGALARDLVAAGAEVVVADVDPEAVERVVERLGVKAVDPDEVLELDCDLLAPCALGGVLSTETIPRLRCAAVVGSANDQLSDDVDALRLVERGILYAPDFVVNAGGMINIAVELDGYSEERATDLVDRIGERLRAVLDEAEARGVDPHRAAVELAERRITDVRELRAMRKAEGR